jgi:hypothetical protein
MVSLQRPATWSSNFDSQIWSSSARRPALRIERRLWKVSLQKPHRQPAIGLANRASRARPISSPPLARAIEQRLRKVSLEKLQWQRAIELSNHSSRARSALAFERLLRKFSLQGPDWERHWKEAMWNRCSRAQSILCPPLVPAIGRRAGEIALEKPDRERAIGSNRSSRAPSGSSGPLAPATRRRSMAVSVWQSSLPISPLVRLEH